MGNSSKRTDEWRTQQNITRLLNKMAKSKDRTERKIANEEIRDWTYGFWLMKFRKMRKVLRSTATPKNKCKEIQQIIDTPKEKWMNLSDKLNK